MNRAYMGSQPRALKNASIHRLETDDRLLGRRRVLEMVADEMVQLTAEFQPAQADVQPGWLVFTGTRVTGPKARPGQSAGDDPLVTLAWPVIWPHDLEFWLNLPPGQAGRRQQTPWLKKRWQRLIEHGLKQPDGPVALTTADLGLMLSRTPSQISRLL